MDREDGAIQGPAEIAAGEGARAGAMPPLFRIDPGWPFVVAGLLLLVAGVLIPAQRDLQELRNALELHRAAEDRAVRQLGAYDRFLNDLEAGEPQLVRRLAASELNVMPREERSLLLVPTLNATVTEWIESTEPLAVPTPEPYPDTLLARLATGPRRLWVLACGAFLVFVGLCLAPSAGAPPRTRRDWRRGAPIAGGGAAVSAAVASTLVAGAESEAEPEALAALDAERDVEAAAEAEAEAEVEAEVEAAAEAAAEAEVEAEVNPEAEAAVEAESVSEIDAAADAAAADETALVCERRAETEALAASPIDDAECAAESPTDPEQLSDSDEPALPRARSVDPCDRALDSLSLFDGVADDRWIETRVDA